MSVPNTILAIDALMGLLDAATKIQTALARAAADGGRDITDEEILVLNVKNIALVDEVIDLIKTKLGELN